MLNNYPCIVEKKQEQGKTSTLRNELSVAPGPRLEGGVTTSSSQATAKYVLEFTLVWVSLQVFVICFFLLISEDIKGLILFKLTVLLCVSL